MKRMSQINSKVDRVLRTLKIEAFYGLKAFFYFICLIFLVGSIYMSQRISPLYFDFVNNDRASTVLFLKKTQHLPDYKEILAEQKQIFGSSIQTQVYANQEKRKKIISELETLLSKNPKARDVLYDLFLLNEQDGNDQKAQEYLNRAQAVDPLVGR